MVPEKRWGNVLAVLLALGLWQLAAVCIGNRLILVGPIQVIGRLLALLGEKTFWQALGFTFRRISLGFFLGFFAAAVLAVFSYRFPLGEVLLRPYLLAVQSIPVASFIVIALLWLSGKKLSTFIAFLMVLPVLYRSILQGLHGADPALLEMAKVFRMPLLSRIRGIYLPAAEPYVLSSCHAALGLCWKAGVAAEVIAVTGTSVGGMLYEAKVYLEISDLFAWTLVIVAMSSAFEWVTVRVLTLLFAGWEGRPWK